MKQYQKPEVEVIELKVEEEIAGEPGMELKSGNEF